jgi:acyl-CoA reductase-like NAD-dependent aldehyde dehydrogenase
LAAVGVASGLLRAHRGVLIGLLAWEIGKTVAAASNDVDRCVAGIDWYLGEIGGMVEGRRPLGLVSNIASWNYPFSVLLLNVLVQALSGNAVVAKIPTQGGGVSLTLAFALLRRAGLPVTLIGGRGADLTEPLVGHAAIDGLAFVGGRRNGAAIAARLRGTGTRFALEMEGVNPYVVTRFSDWDGLAKQIRGGFDYGKQRCTAYTRWVVERSLVPAFLETYRAAVSDIRVGHPYLEEASGRPVDFGPLISATKVRELRGRTDEAVANGAEVVYGAGLDDADFLPGQERGAYLAPTLLLGLGAPSDLYAREPFGPVDAVVAADSEDGLIAEANVSGGSLVASVATDDAAVGERIAGRLMSFKVGINRLRSRGDRDEAFGGLGGSWAGAFVGGENLVRAFTEGPQEVRGHWPE